MSKERQLYFITIKNWIAYRNQSNFIMIAKVNILWREICNIWHNCNTCIFVTICKKWVLNESSQYTRIRPNKVLYSFRAIQKLTSETYPADVQFRSKSFSDLQLHIPNNMDIWAYLCTECGFPLNSWAKACVFGGDYKRAGWSRTKQWPN